MLEDLSDYFSRDVEVQASSDCSSGIMKRHRKEKKESLTVRSNRI